VPDALIKKNKLKTGHCDSGWHEGSNPDLGDGKSAPTCKQFLECPCECHLQYDQMFEEANLPRILIDNSSYKVKNTLWLPTIEERAALRLETLKKKESIQIQEPETEHSVQILVRTFNETPTGRQARGQLEQLVLLAVTRWVSSDSKEDCSINWICANIEEIDKITLASKGAIQAVLRRWMDIEFVLVGGQPFQFFGFTPEGKQYGLDTLKLRAKSKAKTKARKNAHRIPGKRK
jgi:hypothetical protein